MTLAELLPAIQSLPREDKLRLIQHLAQQITQEEGITTETSEAIFPLWSQYNAFEGAATLLQVLNQERT